MTFDFNFNFTEPNGTEIKPDQNAASILCNSLAPSLQKQNVLKIWGWLMKLSKSEPLELDLADQKVLTDLIENSDGLTLLAKGQLLEYIAKQASTKT